jgi:TonB family protein
MRRVAQTILLVLGLAAVCHAQDAKPACDFSSYNPLFIDHPPLNAAVKKIQPEYPAVAKASHVQGDVQVKILVDRKGNVVEACVADGHPLLGEAARSAALEWKFKPNFGFSRKSKFKQQYLQRWIVFHFHLD